MVHLALDPVTVAMREQNRLIGEIQIIRPLLALGLRGEQSHPPKPHGPTLGRRWFARKGKHKFARRGMIPGT